MRQNPFRILKSLIYLYREDGMWLSHKLKFDYNVCSIFV